MTGLPQITAGQSFTGKVGVAFSQTPAFTGTINSWALANGSSLPAGLSLNGTSGLISGVPTIRANSNCDITYPFNYKAIAADRTSFAVKTDGTIVGWEQYGGFTFMPTGENISGFTGVRAITVGDRLGAIINDSGEAELFGVAWGAPKPNVVAVSSGGIHLLSLKSDGTVEAVFAGVAVGYGPDDPRFVSQQYAYGNRGQAEVPVGLTGVLMVAAGAAHSLALKADGQIVGWGNNTFGEITIPAGLTGVVAVDAGGVTVSEAVTTDTQFLGYRNDYYSSFSLALKNDGSVVGWGSNDYGQITIPAGLTGVIKIAAGRRHALALKSDGTVVEWGGSEVAVPIGLSDVVDIAAGDNRSLALQSDGSIVAWGQAGEPTFRNSTQIAFTIADGVPLITASQTASGTVGTAFSKTFSLTDSTNRPVTSWAATGLPSWATLNTTTGAITGTPQDTGSTTISLTATGAGGTSAATTATISIAVGPPIIVVGQSFTGKVGVAFTQTPTLDDAMDRPATSWSATGLPAGLSLNTTTGAITGTPTAKGSFTASFTATGGGGTSAARSVAFTIADGAPIITAGQTLSGKVGYFSVTPALTDAANRSVTGWAATGLPSWATLNTPTTGAITGTPQDTGSTTISLTVTGPGGADTQTVTLLVAVGAPIIVAGQSFAGKVGEAFTQTPALDDALDRPATSWTAMGLPAGLSLNAATGAITGTPTAKGSFTASFTATGGGGASAATSIAFTIADGVPQIGGSIGNWGEVVLPAQVGWSAAAYGNGKFVCVANSGMAAYSSDGRSWTQVALPNVQPWTSVTYGMAYNPFGGTRTGRFVAVGGGVAAYSDDGVVWTQAALPSNRQWYVTYGTSEPGWSSTIGGDMVITSPDRYVAVGWNSNAVAHSHDGVTWTVATLPLSRQWDSVAFGDGRFVAVSANGGTFAYSSNGQNWTVGSMPSVQSWNGVAYGNGIFVCVSSGGANAVAYGNGVTWSQATLDNVGAGAWSAVAYEGGVFVAVAGGPYGNIGSSDVSAYSSNGRDWVQSDLPAWRHWSSVVGGGGRFVAIASGHGFAALMDRRGQVGVPFAISFFAVDTTNRPVTSWAATGLPAGLSMNAATGAITGAPTNTGSTTISLTATGPGGTSATITETILVVAVSDFSAEILCICEVSATLFEGILLTPSFSAQGAAQMQIVGPLSLSVEMSAVGVLSVGGSWYFYGDVLGSFVGSAVFDGKLRLLELKRFVCGEFESVSGGGKAVVFCYTTVNGRITPQPLVSVGLKFFQDKAAAQVYREEFEAPRQFDYVSVADGRSVIEGEVNVLAPCGVYNIWAVSEPPPGDVRVHFSVNLQRA
jgi:alpha-tubulin suppressor-like RCC1 family protein